MMRPAPADSLSLPPIRRGVNWMMQTAATRWGKFVLGGLLGTVALDNERLARVHTRFAGEVMAVGTPTGHETTELPDEGSSAERPLQVGDRVRKGQLLAVVWSKDLGEKKSELIDALSKLKFDR